MKNAITALLLISALIILGIKPVGAQQATDITSTLPVCSAPSTYGMIDINNWSVTQQDNGAITFDNPNQASLSCNDGGKNRCVVRMISKNPVSGDFSISVTVDQFTTTYVKGQSLVFIMNLNAEKTSNAYRLGIHQNDKGKYIEFNPTINNNSFVSSTIFELPDLADLTLTIEKKGSILSGYSTQNGVKTLIASVNGFPANEGYIPYFVASNSPGSDPTTNFGSMKTVISNVKAECEQLSSLTPTLINEKTDTGTNLLGSNEFIIILGALILTIVISIITLIITLKNTRKS